MSHQVTDPPTLEGEAGERFVTIAFLCDRYDTTRQTIYRWVKADRLPAPIRIGPRSPRFAFSKIVERERSSQLVPAEDDGA